MDLLSCRLRKIADPTRLDDVHFFKLLFIIIICPHLGQQVMTLEIIVEDILMTLRRLHNRLTPVHKLPLELLSTIFESTNDVDLACDNTRTSFNISHVCQNWRETAIRCPRLWSKIKMSAGSPLAHELCLERSGNVPLVVTIRVPSEWEDPDDRIDSAIPRNIQLLAPQPERILSIDLDSPLERTFFFSHLDFSVPSLERFSCTTWVADGWKDKPTFPSSLFNGHMPSLKTVVFAGVPWKDLGPFRNLTDIRISGSSSERLKKPDFSQVLQRSPLLEHLEVRGYFPDDGDTLIALPRLKSLSLLDTYSCFFLSYLDTPGIQQLTILDPYPSTVVIPNNPFLPNDPSRLPITQRLRQLAILTKAHPNQQILIEGEDESGSITFKFSKPWHHYCRVDPTTWSHLFATTWSYLSTTSLTSLTELTIDWSGQDVPSGIAIRSFFANASSIQTLRLLKAGCDGFLQPFVEDVALCPDLERIYVTISSESYDLAFRAVESIVCARRAVGRTVRIGHIVAVEGGEGMSEVWNELCDEHRIER
jgi:hypothetical protein